MLCKRGLMISMSIVFDNYEFNPDLQTAWGFACLVASSDGFLLFDTGSNGDILLDNIKNLKLDPKKIRKLLLSHDHWDHTGGLKSLLNENTNLEVYVLPSFSDETKETVTQSGAHLIENSGLKMILPGIHTTGMLGTTIKEQSLIIETNKGLVIITGCAHPGIIKIVEHVKEQFNKKIYMVFGGFHLMNHSDTELLRIIVRLKELGVEKIGPCHCSSDRCRLIFKEEFKNDYIDIGVGKILEIE
jgi:7,8-dihydropterin-6-yl-methyl-4-(beta-D-ribofuranosyl)aminobenzene 5'-phosphate synthase